MCIQSVSDVTLQIAFDLQWLQNAHLNIKLDHVKVHQDDGIEYSELAREFEDVYRYATNFIREGEIKLYDELPENPIHFYLNNHIINRDIKKKKFGKHHNYSNYDHI
jgi:hypothetical protein